MATLKRIIQSVLGREFFRAIRAPALWHVPLWLAIIPFVSCSLGESSSTSLVTVFNIIANCFLILSGLTLVGVTLALAFERGPGGLETFLRVLAIVLGFFIYFGSRAAGFSVPELISGAMRDASPLRFWLVAVILPAVGGLTVSWYLVMQFEKDTNITARVGIMISVFVVVMFAEVYAKAFQLPGTKGEFNHALLPNLSFVTALGLYAVLRAKPR
jgi:hypothetical protein